MRNQYQTTNHKDPAQIPESPDPAIARPTMRVFEVCAVALTMEPVSNITIDHKKQYKGEKIVYALPHGSWVMAQAIKYAEPYQPMSSKE